MIFETHAHYEDTQFDQDRDELLRSMYAHGIDKIQDPHREQHHRKKCGQLRQRALRLLQRSCQLNL